MSNNAARATAWAQPSRDTLLGAATLWSLLVFAGIWALPVVTILSGVDGASPRVTMAAAGDRLGSVVFALPLAGCLTGIAVLFLTSLCSKRWRSWANALVRGLAVVLFVLGVIGAVTILLGLVVIPAAVLLLAATFTPGHDSPQVRAAPQLPPPVTGVPGPPLEVDAVPGPLA